MKASAAGQKHKLNIKYTIRISKNKIKIETVCTICYLSGMGDLHGCEFTVLERVENKRVADG